MHAIEELEKALAHLARAGECLDMIEQPAAVIQARTLIAVSRASSKNARRLLQKEKED